MSGDPLAFEVFNEVGIIDQLARTKFERVLPKGMTIAQFSVLNHLVRLGGDWSPARLASAFQVTRPTMTSTLARLNAAGLVAVRGHPDDGRAKLVSITAKGMAARDACLAALAPLLPQVAAVIAREDFEAALPILRRMRAALDAMRD